jgi:hypothetical protein
VSVNVAVLLLLGGDQSREGDERHPPQLGRDGCRWLIAASQSAAGGRCLRTYENKTVMTFISGALGIILYSNRILLASKELYVYFNRVHTGRVMYSTSIGP